MASTSEVGIAKNVGNFQDLIAFVEGYGATYNPSNDRLKLPQLNTLYTQANADLDLVRNKNTAYNNAINERLIAFSGLRSLSTRLVNALQTTDASKEKIDDAKGFNRKIQGKRASKKEVPVDPNEPAPKTISASQQSFDEMIQHLEGLTSVLESEPSYTPNEDDLKITALNAKADSLNDKNANVATAHAAVSNARIARNKTINKDDIGLVDTAGDVKKYVKSVYGATSPEFAQIKGIKFRKIMD